MIFDHFASSRTIAAAYSSGVPGVVLGALVR